MLCVRKRRTTGPVHNQLPAVSILDLDKGTGGKGGMDVQQIHAVGKVGRSIWIIQSSALKVIVTSQQECAVLQNRALARLQGHNRLVLHDFLG